MLRWKRYKDHLTVISFLSVSIIIIGIVVVLFRTSQLQEQKQAQEHAVMEDRYVLEKLKKIILLPNEVTPTMAIVTDVDVLKNKNPIFFADAKNGDRLIVYPDMAIIYDEHSNKIIKIGPVQYASP